MSNYEKNGMDRAVDAAITAKKIAAIAKAAAMAGVKGAALQAAKEFSPQLVKIIIIILMILILLPFLIVAALPNIFFQYDTADSSVKNMTDKAISIEEAYKFTKDYNEQEIKELIEGLSEGYDDVEISENGDNLNHYWYIAICSVAYNQDLFLMDEQDIKNRQISGFNLFNLKTSETEYEADVDGQVQTLKKLKVDISNIDPEGLMAKLDFTEGQKNWARTIYRTISDDQSIKPGDFNYIPGESLADYGDITFKQGETDVVYYNQGDSRWGMLMYGKYDTIKDCGCGPTSMAIVVSSFTDNLVDPKQMADWAYENGYCAPNRASYHSLIPNCATNFGLQVEGATRYEGQKIVDALADGKLVVAIMGPGHFTTGGHFMVLRGVTSDGKILVADPGSRKNNNIEWDLSIILDESRRGAGAGGPFWIISP